VPWQPPEIWADLSDMLLNQILTRIDNGLPDDERYSDATAAKGRAAWRVVAEMAEKTEAQAKAIIKAWIKSGTLERREYHSETERKALQGLWVNASKRPGTVYE
jgi:hypothetical protein